MKYLRHVREKRGLSQDKLAELAGVPQNTISLIERGERKPHRNTLEKLAQVLDVEHPSTLALNLAPVQTFEELIDGTPEQRRAYIEYRRETGLLPSFIENLNEIFEASIEDYHNDAMARARVESAFVLGYVKAVEEGRDAREESSRS
jgi:transcriptional regulator with XRE-family HTH domain